jgi:hypothetical protein
MHKIKIASVNKHYPSHMCQYNPIWKDRLRPTRARVRRLQQKPQPLSQEAERRKQKCELFALPKELRNFIYQNIRGPDRKAFWDSCLRAREELQEEESFDFRMALRKVIGNLQQRNISLWSDMLSLLESRFKTEHLQLKNIYREKFVNLEQSFNHWTTCLRLVIQFYDSGGFHGNLSTRKEFLKTIPPSKRKMILVKPIITQCALVYGWHRQRGIDIEDSTKEVGSLLTHLAAWDDGVDIERVEQTTLDLTKEVWAWFW